MSLTREQSIAKYGTEAYTAWGETEAAADARVKGIQTPSQADIAAYNQKIAASQQQEKLDAFNLAQRGRESEFLTRFQTAIPEARTAIETELGLPGLRQSALTAGQTARDIQGQFEQIAPTQQTVAQQVGISAPRLQQRISSKTAELAPALSAASRGLAGTTEALALGQETYGQRMGETMLPFTTEAGMLSDSLAREMTGFTTQIQSELEVSLQKLRNQGALDVAEMQKLERLAQQEQDYLNQRQMVNLGNRQALINPITGQEISSYQQGLAPKRIAPINEWE